MLFPGCNQGTSSREGGAAEGIQEPSAGADAITSVESELLALILGDFGDGLFRGVSFGDSREKVKITESFELFEESALQLGYTHDTRQLETVDVYYYFAGADTSVVRITVDVFLNSKASTERLWKETKLYYDRLYGEGTEESPLKMSWKRPQVQLVVENVSSGIDTGIKMTFIPAGREVLTHSQKAVDIEEKEDLI